MLEPIDGNDPFVAKAKLLSTKFVVNTWRVKPSPEDSAVDAWMCRSRFVGREFAWLEPDREQLFSPASNQLLVRILPSLQMRNRNEGWCSLTLDVTDAFLTVDQPVDTVVRAVVDGVTRYYKLIKLLPG